MHVDNQQQKEIKKVVIIIKALILNSGMGKRMGTLTSEHPKCMTEISDKDTILSRQLKQLSDVGIKDIIMTTGAFENVLVNYCNSLSLPVNIIFVHNPIYDTTNYIYSIYLARKHLDDDIMLLHGDMVFENSLIDDVINMEKSCMVVCSASELPQKDFKAVIDSDQITKVGVEFFNDAVAAQPMYKLLHEDWNVWLSRIIDYCDNGITDCYAENALNEISDKISLIPFDAQRRLCSEIDTPEDLAVVSSKLKDIENRKVYMCFATDVLHSGHMNIIKKAQRLGKLTVGILSDEAVASYKRFPLVTAEERKAIFRHIVGIDSVVDQETLSYKDNLLKIKPDIVVHGDDWKDGDQKEIRDEVVDILAGYGGKLVEFKYSDDEKYKSIDDRMRAELSLPDIRRARLKKLLKMKGIITAMEAHSGITGLIVEKTVEREKGGLRQFDAMWISSLCDSTAKGKPDIELVDMTSRFRTIDDIMEVTTKPIIFDGDTGGLTEHFVYTVRSLERMGVSMVIIEDKTGLKKNSLFGTDVVQTQDTIENFSEKIRAGKNAQKTKDFMICARIESLILEQGMDDALIRAHAFVKAGADAIMIHSRKKDPAEIFEFIKKFRVDNLLTPIVLVPTSFNTVTEEEFKQHGANIIIYANQLTRTGFPAMQEAARTILKNHRAKECDDMCMSIKEIINLIPEE